MKKERANKLISKGANLKDIKDIVEWVGGKYQSINERFHEYVYPEPNTGCWLWSGKLTPHGYGVIGLNYMTRRAHRVSYELYKEQIPKGLVIDHLCRNRSCVNPDHLEAVTRRENTHRGDSLIKHNNCLKCGGEVVYHRRANGKGSTRLQRECPACRKKGITRLNDLKTIISQAEKLAILIHDEVAKLPVPLAKYTPISSLLMDLKEQLKFHKASR